jgi:hypothetical protein
VSRPNIPPLWQITIARHSIPPRFVVAEQTYTMPACNLNHARRLAINEAHRKAGAPPMERCILASLPYTRAERVDREKPMACVTAARGDDGCKQAEIFSRAA